MLLFLVLFLHCPHQGGFGISGDLVIVGVSRKAVQVPGESTLPAVQPERAVPCARVVRPAQIKLAAKLLGRIVRYAPGVRVHYPAYRAGSIQEGARSLVDLYPVGNKRVHGHGMITAGHGYVQRVDAVFQHAHAGAAQPMYDRPSHGHAK